MFLDGLQQERVAGNSLHWHHQEETKRGGVYVRPGEMSGSSEYTLFRFSYFYLHFELDVCKENDRNLR